MYIYTATVYTLIPEVQPNIVTPAREMVHIKQAQYFDANPEPLIWSQLPTIAWVLCSYSRA